MSSTTQVALITGGVSGIGLAVAEALASRGGWDIHLLDRNDSKGAEVASKLSATFHHVDVTDYDNLAKAFASTYIAHKRIDFVFANAGVAPQPGDVPEKDESSDAPPASPKLEIIDINLRSVIHTTHLAAHYFGLCSASSSTRSLVITASAAGLYGSPTLPVYAATKHGVVGWTRSVAPVLWKEVGVRVNAICPGLVRTSIMPAEVLAQLPEQLLTSLDTVVDVVLRLVDGEDDVAKSDGPIHGWTVEISGKNHYYTAQPEPCDQLMATILSPPGS